MISDSSEQADSFTKAAPSLLQMSALCIYEIGNCDVQKRLDLAAGAHISSALYCVTWVGSPPSICAWISHLQSEFVSACVPLSTDIFLPCPCSAIFFGGGFTPQVADSQEMCSAGLGPGLATGDSGRRSRGDERGGEIIFLSLRCCF